MLNGFVLAPELLPLPVGSGSQLTVAVRFTRVIREYARFLALCKTFQRSGIRWQPVNDIKSWLLFLEAVFLLPIHIRAFWMLSLADCREARVLERTLTPLGRLSQRWKSRSTSEPALISLSPSRSASRGVSSLIRQNWTGTHARKLAKVPILCYHS